MQCQFGKLFNAIFNCVVVVVVVAVVAVVVVVVAVVIFLLLSSAFGDNQPVTYRLLLCPKAVGHNHCKTTVMTNWFINNCCC